MSSPSPKFFFPDTAIMFGLDIEIDEHKDMIQKASCFLNIRTHLNQEITRLKSISPGAFQKSTKRKLFQSNLSRMIRKYRETQALPMTFLNKESDGESHGGARFDLFILTCFGLLETHFQQIELHGLTETFPHMLRRVVGRIEIPPGTMGAFAKIIKELCGKDALKDEVSKRILGSSYIIILSSYILIPSNNFPA